MADEPTPAPDDRPEWLAEKYTTVEEQARAYAEAQVEMNRAQESEKRAIAEREQERQSFTAALEGMQAPAPAPQQGQAFDPALSAYAAAYEQGDVQGMLAAQAQYVQAPVIDAVGRLIDEKFQAFGPAVDQVRADVRQNNIMLAQGVVERTLGPEQYAAVMPAVQELVATNRDLLPDFPSVEGYADRILFLARNADYDRVQRENAAYAQEQADKRAAQTLSPGYNRQALPADAAAAEFERIKNTPTGSFQELLARSRGGS